MKDKAGFTLLELLVVIGILAVAAAVSLPNLSGWQGKRNLKNDFDRLSSYLGTVKVEAIARNTKTKLELHSYGADHKLTGSWKNGGKWEAFKDIDGTLEKTTVAGPVDLEFSPDGSVSSCNGVQTCQYTVSSDHGRYRATVHLATGFLEKEKYDPKTKTWSEI
ncbi:MAG TPA: prepilin-type N-terminal cleavage/methylation domain-containing protein [Desulfobacterales bacterium]|jgi:prepilin-type N-terminal cleavage/methylation domain-containing protein|nr:prepilin-type N-terminal cleavage/methylation domain-containing protein [Lentisphaeria bacterium]HJO62984.1 prepilin-type N-terminal cleavage/methylation domain-containing protein [Desulfobacterales bacterium]|tara:strand:+ start:285 stop:773 length:489 start_codon:yes stop_codon:yes gene_type:complete